MAFEHYFFIFILFIFSVVVSLVLMGIKNFARKILQSIVTSAIVGAEIIIAQLTGFVDFVNMIESHNILGLAGYLFLFFTIASFIAYILVRMAMMPLASPGA